jgi:hypothetical protein
VKQFLGRWKKDKITGQLIWKWKNRKAKKYRTDHTTR